MLTVAVNAARAALAGTWRILTGDPRTTYQPELHYMRGPGPKWREKHMRGRGTAQL
jgi:hypothetical protein